MNTQKLIKVMVLFSLLGFLGLSSYVFYACIKNSATIEGPIIYMYNILNGLVGGIFALAFGLPAPSSPQGQDRMDQKIHSLSDMLPVSDSSHRWAYFYALSYMIVGFAAIGIWMFYSNGVMCNYIESSAQVFSGMLVAIVTGFFK